MAKYTEKEKDAVVLTLLKLANEIVGRDYETQENLKFDVTDITGSIACWGIVQE